MKQITAKFKSVCAETGKVIKKGDQMIYDYQTKKCYCMDSQTATKHNEPTQESLHVQANEDAYFDNFCQQNNI